MKWPQYGGSESLSVLNVFYSLFQQYGAISALLFCYILAGNCHSGYEIIL